MGFGGDDGLGAAMAQSYVEGLGKDANAKVDALSARVTELEGKLEQLTGLMMPLRAKYPNIGLHSFRGADALCWDCGFPLSDKVMHV